MDIISSSLNHSKYILVNSTSFLPNKRLNSSSISSSPDAEHSLITNYEDFYNGIALGILITGILILAFIIVFYYVKNKDHEARARNETWTDENGLRRGVRTTEDRDELRRMSADPPPSYVETVCRSDPPAYKESLMQQELNPVVNPEWALRQASENLDKEIQEVVLKRVNSCTHGKLYSLIIEEGSSRSGDPESSREMHRETSQGPSLPSSQITTTTSETNNLSIPSTSSPEMLV
eukprot:TRINITY_DN8309_c0_g1_i1.p1 TRINITY_DN8309_c0_g1~~TRINITY_DN8309_c0_g1_i1.p1  ORF type:complete len:235 (-),score=48.18 TRINITY_DN8309_c0_g1_i1:361-1065(-)